MTNTAIQIEKFKTLDHLLPYRGSNIYPAGIQDKDKGFVRYGTKPTDQPNLIISNPIYDDDGNAIMPGYYEVLLSDDRQTLILAQSQIIVATIPVFKIEEDRTKEKITQPRDNRSQRKVDKEEKKKEKQRKKLIREGKMAPDGTPEIYTNATIEYEDDGNYYLIKYERESIKAWGALKL